VLVKECACTPVVVVVECVNVGKGEEDSGGVNCEGEGGEFNSLVCRRVGVGDVVGYRGEYFGVVALCYWGSGSGSGVVKSCG
jgi:hypothetical protein